MSFDWNMVFEIIKLAFIAGAGYAGVRKGINGTKNSLDRIENKVETLHEKVGNNKDKIAENKNKIDNQKAICKERSKTIDKIEDKL